MTLTGVDISVWQDDPTTEREVNFETMKNVETKFAFMRAMFGIREDVNFYKYWRGTKDVGLPRGAYFFPLTLYSAATQANKFVEMLKDDGGEMPPVIDIERYNGTVLNANAIKTMIGIIEDNLNVTPIIYTGYYVWRDEVVGSSDSFFSKYPLWIANYYVDKPMIPKPWKDWTFWQYSDKGDGLKYGVESLQIDMDYFNGDQEDFNNFISGKTVVTSEEVIVSSGSLKFKTIGDMNVRSGAGTQYPVVSRLSRNKEIIPLDFGGDDAWIKTEDGWVCKSRKGTNFLNKL
jgi:lysozyme